MRTEVACVVHPLQHLTQLQLTQLTCVQNEQPTIKMGRSSSSQHCLPAMDHSKTNNIASNSCVLPSLRPRANHHTHHWRAEQELLSPGEIKIPASHRCPCEHYCSCKTCFQQCPTDHMTLSFSGGFFLLLLQTGCHGSFSFKPNTTHLNWCKGAGKKNSLLSRKTQNSHPLGKSLRHGVCISRGLHYIYSLSPQTFQQRSPYFALICLFQLLFQHFREFYTTQNS